MYREFFDAELIAAWRARDRVMRNAEVRMAAAVFNTTSWTGSALTTAITNEWDDSANATPRADVKAAKLKVWDNSGLLANALIINHILFEHLKDVAAVIDRLKYAGYTDPNPALIGERALAQALGIDMIIVAGSPKNTAKEGQDASISPVWSSEYAMVARVATTQDVREPCIGRTFHWGEDGSDIGGTVDTYYEERRRSDIVRVRHQVDEKTLYVQAGHLLSNAIT
jgi:hypothetical protein